MFYYDYTSLIEPDEDMKRPVMRPDSRRQRIGLRFDRQLPAATRPGAIGIIGKKGIPAGMQDIKVTSVRPGHPPGCNSIVPFPGRIQPDIDIAIVFIEKTQVTDRPRIDIKILDVP